MDCGNPTSNFTLAKIQYVSGTAPGTTNYLASTVISCMVGYKWTDGAITKSVTCLSIASWQPVESCIGFIIKLIHSC